MNVDIAVIRAVICTIATLHGKLCSEYHPTYDVRLPR